MPSHVAGFLPSNINMKFSFLIHIWYDLLSKEKDWFLSDKSLSLFTVFCSVFLLLFAIYIYLHEN